MLAYITGPASLHKMDVNQRENASYSACGF